MRLFMAFLFPLLAMAALPGCKASCSDLCQNAQDKHCTTITGSCSDWCDAMNSLSDTANCTNQADDYTSCSRDDDVCTTDARCAGEKNALGTCLAPYCAAHTSDPDCNTVVGGL